MHKIKLILIDVDGIMTDGTKIYNEDHEVIYKKFCDLDFTAIRRLMASDVNVCLDQILETFLLVLLYMYV